MKLDVKTKIKHKTARINEDTVSKIKSCTSKSSVRKVICKLTEHHDLLRENGIKAIYPKTKSKKPNLKGAEFDQTLNSVRTIYTPMGNKRWNLQKTII